MPTIERVNDFVVKFANVNGSGSASANGLFAKAILRMGVPVAARNIFPSNIQGMPTWYEVRVVEAGWRGRRGGVELMVAMNPETWKSDLAEVEAGGYVFYDSTKALPRAPMRDDITLLGVPLTEICHEAYADVRQRQLFKNIMYVGALAAILGIEADVVDGLLAVQFRGKDKAPLLEANRNAFRLGFDHASEHLEPIGLRVMRRDRVGERIFIDGNAAAGLGAVYGGATVCAWYPITPSTSLPESFARQCRRFRTEPETGRHRFAFIQAEDELASIGMVVGAGWNGARAFTATSGPGISLMQEFIGLAYFAEIPAVLFDVQRGSPSTGMPTKTQQCDLLLAAYASHGDTKHVLLFPEDPTECFSMGAQAFDLADRLQTPIFVLLDLDIGMQEWLTEPFRWDDTRRMDRGKVMTHDDLESGKDFGRYLDVDGDGIPYRTWPGTHPKRGAFFTRGTSKDRYARYTEDGATYVDNMQRLLRKFETAKSYVPGPVVEPAAQPTRAGVIWYGSTGAPMAESLAQLEAQGVHLDRMRVRAFPFSDAVAEFVDAHEHVFVVEQNRDGQLRMLLINECSIDPQKLVSILHYDGNPLTARYLTAEIAEKAALFNVTPLRPKGGSVRPQRGAAD
ncbi:MAG: 2-oxoacid:acceptor oxidoreductase subunit alpha [Betaproteobacteria bacterium]|nr:2-oxoacid:acceptor oxidoreductase subunit alpha [Betaproteobacteria bacterium]